MIPESGNRTFPPLKLRAGEWVEVKPKAEILRTLDKSGRLEQLPFSPQMLQYCGKRFQVFKRAHKTCDTVNEPVGRGMADAVHLEGLRCDGQAYGGCQALCMLFWKEAWLKRVAPEQQLPSDDNSNRAQNTSAVSNGGCTEGDVHAGTQSQTSGETRYVCQATQLPFATTPLSRWDFRQYLQDYVSGNVGVRRMLRGFVYAGYYNLIQAGIGLGPVLRWFYDWFQAVSGGVPFPRKRGAIAVGQPTPAGCLDLQPGELVRVKPYDQILATLNAENKNRGLYFDAEMVPFCGGTYQVRQRVSRIVDEKTGKLISLKSDCIILENAFCQARYSRCRLFCPRSIYSYWREIWLERVGSPAHKESSSSSREALAQTY